jgi:hypothetical protein
MEADWEVEIGPDAAVIDAEWEGWTDLRAHPERVHLLAEVADFAPLADALLALNRVDSPVWTSKSDIWELEEPASLDPLELNAAAGDCNFALACYLDCLPTASRLFPTLPAAEQWCRALVRSLRSLPLANCRIDLVMRTAVTAGQQGFGVTAYVTACGSSQTEARNRLGSALAAFAQIASIPTPEETALGLQ